MDRTTMFVVMAVIGAILVVSGYFAYRGKYVAWMLMKSFLPGWPGLAGLFLGIWMILFPVVGWLIDVAKPLGALVVVFVWFPSLLLGIIGMFWLPRFLLPQWIKDDIEEIRRGEDPLSQALKPGGSLYGRLGVPKDQWPENQARGKHGNPPDDVGGGH